MNDETLPSVKGYLIQQKQSELKGKMHLSHSDGKDWPQLRYNLREAWQDGDDEECRRLLGRMYAVRIDRKT